MPVVNATLLIDVLPVRYDRTYHARAADSETIYDVNPARLECSCPDWQANRARFGPLDARRICVHVCERLYTTKVERDFDPLLKLFMRYGRTMFDYCVIQDDLGVFLIGQPFEPGVIRVIGVVQGKPLLATYRSRIADWASGETDMSKDLSERVLRRMRAIFPEYVK